MTNLSRRAYLAGALSAASLSGCLDALPGRGTQTATEGGGPTVETLAVSNLPAETIPTRPAGEPALVDFFGTWCPPCKPQMSELRSVHDQFPDLHMVSITQETDEDAIKQFWREYDGTWPVASDPKLQAFQHYDANGVPTKVLVDSDGNVQWRHNGLAAADTIVAEVEAVLE